MIEGNLAILLNLLSVLVLSVILIIPLVSFAVRLRWVNLEQYSASSRRRLFWLLALSPWGIGLLAAVVATLSGTDYWIGIANSTILHWDHIEEFSLYSWHGLSVAMGAIYIASVVARNMLHFQINSMKLTELLALAEPDDKGFYELDTDTIAAFTAGYTYPRCFITKALLRHLSSEEYQIVRLHEEAHARRFDPSKKWLFQLLAAFFPRQTSQMLIQGMTTVMEQCADEAVASVIPDRSVIAMTLLKVRRLAAQPLPQSFATNLLCHCAVDDIKLRIDSLLADCDKKAFSKMRTIVIFAALAILCAMFADVFHHALEFKLAHS